jgi:hypothetical protein
VVPWSIASSTRARIDLRGTVLHNAGRGDPEQQNRLAAPDFRAHLLGRIAWVEAVNPATARSSAAATPRSLVRSGGGWRGVGFAEHRDRFVGEAGRRLSAAPSCCGGASFDLVDEWPAEGRSLALELVDRGGDLLGVIDAEAY